MKLKLSLLFLVVLTFIAHTHAQSSKIAGTVIFVAGEAGATDSNNNYRQLSRRSQIYPGEVITTSAHGAIQLRMVDSSLISLSCNASLRIEDYSYENDVSNDLVVMRLNSGNFRTITGAVGEQNPDRYQFLVDDSRVEIVGTDFLVEKAGDGTLYFANFDGSIRIVNSYGSLRLGIGADGDFALVEPGLAPGLLRNHPVPANSTFSANSELVLSPDC